MARRVNLYIEDTEIKLLVTNGNQVEKWASLMLDQGLVSEGAILDENRVAELIKQLFKLQKVTDTSVVVGISGLNSVFRVISIPEVSRSLLPEAVSNEAGRVLPMPLNQVYYSYQLIPSAKGEMRLFLAAYPRSSTDALLNTMHKAGLKVQLMDLAPLALARCVNANRAILVNVWLTFVDIVILSERIPLVIRSLSLPVEGTSAQERLQAVTEELNRTITFYNSTYPDQQLDKSIELFVSGDITREEDNLKYLGNLGYPVTALKPTLVYKEVFNPTQYMVNVGLAFKKQLPGGNDNQYSIIDFNALPPAYQPTAFSWARVLMPVGAVVAIGLLAYGTMALMSLRNDTSSLTEQYNSLELQNAHQSAANKQAQDSITAQNATATALSSQIQDLQAQITQVQSNEDYFSKLLGGMKLGLDNADQEMHEIVNDIPAGLNITSLQYQTDSITLEGVAPTEELALNYASALRASGVFTSVDVLSIKSLDDGTIGFSLTLH